MKPKSLEEQFEKEKIEEYILEKGWSEYINRCVDLIYFNFQNFGWTYCENEKLNRDEIENNIINLIGHVLELKDKTGQVDLLI